MALSGAAAAVSWRIAGDARRGLDAAAACAAAWREPGTHAALHQGRIAEPDELVQGPRPGDGGHACTRPGRDHALGSVCGQRRLRAGGVRGRCWPGGSRVPAARRQAPVHPGVRPVRGEDRAGGRAHHGCGSHRRRTWRPAWLVRRVNAEGALSPRRQEVHGLRAGRATGLALAGLDRLPHRRRDRPHRDVERLRGAGDDRVGTARTSAPDGLRASRRLCAHREGL